MAVAVAVLFQVHVSLPGGLINLNLGDPLAILALAAVSLRAVFASQPPRWKVRQFNTILSAISLLLLFGFVRGWLEIGVTQWAFSGRLLGWLVLLGYLSAGYLIVAHVGGHALRRFVETLCSTATVVVVLQVILRLLESWGIHTGSNLSQNFQGYAGNRNAFAFQMLTVISLLLGYSHIYSRNNVGRKHWKRSPMFSLLLGILLAGLVWSGSRTGIVVGMLVLILAWSRRLADRNTLRHSLAWAAVLWCSIWVAQGSAQSNFSADDSNQERWITIVKGLEMWQEYPVLGSGLGVFHARSSMWTLHPQVIHSTPIWILAEFGLVGAATLGGLFFFLSCHGIRSSSIQPARRILLFVLLVFTMFCLLHEISYQRIFWLVLGAVLAVPFAARPTHESPS